MHRIDTSTAQKDKFGAGKNGFTGGNPQTGELPTALDAGFFDSLQEEIASLIESAGISLSKSNNEQLKSAMSKLFLSRTSDVGSGTNQIPDMSLFTSAVTSGNGYQKLPGGLVIQFGGATTDSAGKIDLTLPLVYPKATYRVVACAKGSTTDNAAVSTRTNHAGGFSAYTTKSASGAPNAAGPLAFEWITIGF